MLVASLSVIITYQLTKYLPARPHTELKVSNVSLLIVQLYDTVEGLEFKIISIIC